MSRTTLLEPPAHSRMSSWRREDLVRLALADNLFTMPKHLEGVVNGVEVRAWPEEDSLLAKGVSRRAAHAA